MGEPGETSMSQQIRVFRINDYDWYAGRDLDEVKAFVLEQSGMREDEAFDNPCELSDEAMSKLRFRPTDESDLPADSTITFAERLGEMIKDGCEFPAFFASTEW